MLGVQKDDGASLGPPPLSRASITSTIVIFAPISFDSMRVHSPRGNRASSIGTIAIFFKTSAIMHGRAQPRNFKMAEKAGHLYFLAAPQLIIVGAYKNEFADIRGSNSSRHNVNSKKIPCCFFFQMPCTNSDIRLIYFWSSWRLCA